MFRYDTEEYIFTVVPFSIQPGHMSLTVLQKKIDPLVVKSLAGFMQFIYS